MPILLKKPAFSRLFVVEIAYFHKNAIVISYKFKEIIMNSLYLSHSMLITALSTPLVIFYLVLFPILFVIKVDVPIKLMMAALLIFFSAPLNSFVVNMYNQMHTDRLLEEGYNTIVIFNSFQNKEIPPDRSMCDTNDYMMLDDNFLETKNLYETHIVVCK